MQHLLQQNIGKFVNINKTSTRTEEWKKVTQEQVVMRWTITQQVQQSNQDNLIQ